MHLTIFLILCLIWGTSWLGIKVTLEGLPPFIGSGLRFSVALCALGIILLFKRISPRITRRQFLFLAGSGFLAYVMDYGLIYWGEQYLSAGVTAIFFATFPIFTTVFSNFLFRNESFNWTKFTGVFIGFFGVVIVFYDQLIITQFDSLVIMASIANIMGAACASLSTLIVKKYLDGVSPVVVTMYQMLVSVPFLFLIAALADTNHAIQLTPRVVGAVLYLGIFASAFAFILYYYLLRKIGAVSLSLIIYITPIVTLIGDVLLFKETIALRSVIGLCVIFLGVMFTQRRILR